MAVSDQRKPHWFWISDSIIDEYGPTLGPLGIAVYAALARHANGGGECWPSVNTIALECRLSVRSVQNTLRQLAELGLIRITRRTTSEGDWTSNLYTLLEFITLNLSSPLKDVSCTTPVQQVHQGGAAGAPPPDEVAAPDADYYPWDSCLSQLRLQMTRGTFDTWVKGTAAVRTSAGLTIYAVSIYGREWLEHRLRPLIERTVAGVYGEPLVLTFEVRPSGQMAAEEILHSPA